MRRAFSMVEILASLVIVSGVMGVCGPILIQGRRLSQSPTSGSITSSAEIELVADRLAAAIKRGTVPRRPDFVFEWTAPDLMEAGSVEAVIRHTANGSKALDDGPNIATWLIVTQDNRVAVRFLGLFRSREGTP